MPNPTPDSRWVHVRKGTAYTVIAVTNTAATRPDWHPVTVVYRDDDGEEWSRPLEEWLQSVKPTTGENKLKYGLALIEVQSRRGEKYSMRLPWWKDDVRIYAQYPVAQSKMSAPYLCVESRFGWVPWVPTMIEMFSDEWLLRKCPK